MEKLAIDGGIPVRNEKIYYGRQWVDKDDVQAVSQVLTSDFITCGPKVEELERVLAEQTEAKYAVAVSNGTAELCVILWSQACICRRRSFNLQHRPCQH